MMRIKVESSKLKRNDYHPLSGVVKIKNKVKYNSLR
jgi:hypothetical protein